MLHPGLRVKVARLGTDAERLTGDVVSVEANGFRLVPAGGGPSVALAYEDLASLSVRIGRRTRGREGIVLGLVAGALVGAVVKGDDGRALGAAHTALWGASIGALGGRFIGKDRWNAIPIDHLRPGPPPAARLEITTRF